MCVFLLKWKMEAFGISAITHWLHHPLQWLWCLPQQRQLSLAQKHTTLFEKAISALNAFHHSWWLMFFSMRCKIHFTNLEAFASSLYLCLMSSFPSCSLTLQTLSSKASIMTFVCSVNFAVFFKVMDDLFCSVIIANFSWHRTSSQTFINASSLACMHHAFCCEMTFASTNATVHCSH